MKVRLKYLATALLLVSATTFATLFQAAPSDAVGDNCTMSSTLVSSCRPLFGATVGGYTQTTSDNASQYAYGEQRLNNPNVLTDPSAPTTVTSQYDVIHRYHSPTQTSFDANELSYYSRDNTYLYINWKPDTNWANAGGSNTTINDRIDQMADSIKGLGDKKIFLTVFHEPENDVSSGNCTTNGGSAAAGSPTDYVNMWHNVRARFDAKGVTNVVWTMNYMGYQAWNCLVPLLWPGNSYVDWVTYDPYGGGTSSSTLFNDSVSPFYNYLSQNSDSTHDYLSKPWGLAEHGAWANGGTSQAGAVDYWNQAASAITNNTYPKLKMFMTFDTSVNGSSQVGTDFSGQPSITEQTAYNTFASTIFNTDYTAPVPTMPVINSVTPSSGTLTGSQTFTVATNDVVTSVSMSVDGQLVTTDSSAPFSFTLDTGTYANGNHTFTFLAKDAAGNTTSTAITYGVLNPPVIYSVTPGSGTLTGSKTFTVATNDKATSVAMSVDGQLVATDSSTPFSFTLDTNNYTNGNHTFTFVAKDAAGNAATTTITYTILNTPLIYSVTPGSGTIKGTQVFAVSTNKEVSSVTIRVDDKWVATDSSAPWSLSINTKNYKNGTHAIGIKAWDDNGKYYDKVINFTIKN